MRNLKTVLLLLIFILISNCTSFNEAMSGKSRKTTDEFLVKKKDPLVLPPKYEELPLPKSKGEESKERSIEKMLGSSGKTGDDSKSISNLENMILKELKKKN
tara:strand:- start:926 stop:1231 length:306 start_codon:yes stop_codon:yes gene_type:complete